MENFIREENLRLYRKPLLESSDEEQRRVLVILVRLLMEEKAAPKVQVPDVPDTLGRVSPLS